MLTSVLHLTPFQIASPMAAASSRQIPSQSQTTPTPVTFPHCSPNLVLTWTLCPTTCQTFVLIPLKTSSLSQILILKPCCCQALTVAAKLIPVSLYNRTPTPSTKSVLCSHVGGPRWALIPPSCFHTQRESFKSPLPILCLPLTNNLVNCSATL